MYKGLSSGTGSVMTPGASCVQNLSHVAIFPNSRPNNSGCSGRTRSRKNHMISTSHIYFDHFGADSSIFANAQMCK